MWNDDPRVKSRRLSISQIRDTRTFGHTTSRISIYRLDLFGFKTSWCSKQKTHLISAGAAWSCCYSWPNVSRSLHSWPSPHLNFLFHNKSKSKLSYKLNNSSRTSKSKASSARSQAKKNLTATCSSPLDQLASNPADTADTAATTASARDLIAICESESTLQSNVPLPCFQQQTSAGD